MTTTWTILVCPICLRQSPHHEDGCPFPYHEVHQVVSAARLYDWEREKVFKPQSVAPRQTPIFGQQGQIAIYRRNLRVYGDALGPSIDWLRQRGRTWDEICQSASRSGGRDVG